VKADLPYPNLPRVQVPVAADDPVKGKDDARVTIVQFAEYQCYYCNRVNPTLQQLVSDYPNDVRIVFKDFPLGGHSRAMPAAIAAHCAGEQGKYWEMNQVLLENQDALGDDDFVRHAKSVGVDAEPFKKCLGAGAYDAGIQADLEAGQAAGVSATPSFFVNGVFLSGAQPIEKFRAVIDRELKP
jgi:protein-disulfide isomerase